MSEFYKAEYHGFTMEASRASKSDRDGMRGGFLRVLNREGSQISDEVQASCISDEQAMNGALKIVRLKIEKLGEPEPTEPPAWHEIEPLPKPAKGE